MAASVQATAALIGVDMEAGQGSPANWTSYAYADANTTRSGLIAEDGAATSVSFHLAVSGGLGLSYGTDATAAPSHSNDLSKVCCDILLGYQGTAITATWSGLEPYAGYNYWVFSSPVGIDETIQVDGYQSVAFYSSSISSGQNINGEQGSNSRTLDSYAKRVIADQSGEVHIIMTGVSIRGTAASATPSGFALQLATVPDPHEPDDTSGQAGTLVAGTPQFRSIYPSGDRDWVRFTLSQPSQVTLAAGADLGMRLYDGSLVEIGYDDNTDGTTRIEYPCGAGRLPVGSYYVQLGQVADAHVIDGYTLVLDTVPCPDNYEPDNNKTQATTIVHGISQTHNIVPADDQDWVRFTLDEPTAVTISTSGPDTSADTRLWLYDQNLNEIAFNDDNGSDYYSTISLGCGASELPAGTYYVKVDEYQNNKIIDSYQLDLRASSCADPNKPNNDFASATPGACPDFLHTGVSGNTVGIHPLHDVDYYSLSGPAGTLVHIDVDARELGTLLDSTLGAFDSAHTLIASSDDDRAPDDNPGGIVRDSYLAVPIPADGLLYVAVSTYPDDLVFDGIRGLSTGYYNLGIRCDTDADGLPDTLEDSNGNGSLDPGETDPLNPDSDTDGLPDGLEDRNVNGIVDPGETDPSNPDSDMDGLSDGAEDSNHNGQFDSGESSPLDFDTDDDGLTDGYEVNNAGTDPTVSTTVYPLQCDLNDDDEVNLGDVLLLLRQVQGN